jgi:hypothetical protein
MVPVDSTRSQFRVSSVMSAGTMSRPMFPTVRQSYVARVPDSVVGDVMVMIGGAVHPAHTPRVHASIPSPHVLLHEREMASTTPSQSSSRLLHVSSAFGFASARESSQSPETVTNPAAGIWHVEATLRASPKPSPSASR